MKVKITQCDDHKLWYFYEVGNTYEVEDATEYKGEWYRLKRECGEGARLLRVCDVAKVEHNKYSREIKPGIFVDVYDVLKAFNVTNPCLQHLLKKALAAGCRGHKGTEEDLQDILSSAKRAVEMHAEWNN